MNGNAAKLLCVVVVALVLPCAGQMRSRVANHIHQASASYTAEFSITRVQTLANGTTLTHEDTETRARDAQGRQLYASTVSLSRQRSVTNVSIIDPVAHTITHWSSQINRATVGPMPASRAQDCLPNSMKARLAANRTGQEKPVVEDLGTDSIQGIEAHGTRTTTTIPAGEIGNDVPLESTFESWTALSPELNRLMVREIIDEPRSGKSDKELTSFKQGDPDPALFQPPSDYEVVTEEVVKGANGVCPTEEAAKEESAKQ